MAYGQEVTDDTHECERAEIGASFCDSPSRRRLTRPDPLTPSVCRTKYGHDMSRSYEIRTVHTPMYCASASVVLPLNLATSPHDYFPVMTDSKYQTCQLLLLSLTG